MKEKVSSPGVIFGLAIFIALLPISFAFSQENFYLFNDTPYKYFTWSMEGMLLLIFLLVECQVSKRRMFTLAILFLLVPFAFVFDKNKYTFLVLNHPFSSILSLGISLLLFLKIFVIGNPEQKSEF